MGAPRQDSDFDRLAADAATHLDAGRWADAEAAYRAALAMAPGHPLVLHNLGVLEASKGRPAAALEWFDAAIAARPDYASAHYNRAVAFEALGRRREAIADFARTSSLDPAHYLSHRALGFLYLAERDRGRALDHFARTYDLRRGEDRIGIAAKSLDHANRTKLRHDAEQFRYLSASMRNGDRFAAMARNYEAVGIRCSDTASKLSDADLETLGNSYNTAINLRDAPEVADGALGATRHRAQILRDFRNGNGVASFDDCLGPRAYASLRRYLLESTIWHDFSHIGGFVASYLEDGLACPLLLQVADELRALLPELLGSHPLSQAWSFKAVVPNAAIAAHVDDGAVSVNFWMTPSAANIHAEGGGMGVCRAPPPAEWPMRDYEQDQSRAVTFLERNRGSTLVVPYRENRAVLFASRLLHYSNCPEFAEGYENHRINVTLVFGSRALHLAEHPFAAA